MKQLHCCSFYAADMLVRKEIMSTTIFEVHNFLLAGEGDKVQCFNCARCLQECEEGDDPMEQHAKWFPE